MKDKLRLLKFDSVYPFEALTEKQGGQRQHLLGLGYDEYYSWVMRQRLGLSDFLTHHMNEAGWEAREVIAADTIFLQKLPGVGCPSFASEAKASLKRLASSSLQAVVNLEAFREDSVARNRRLLERYIVSYQPDVLFVREPSHVKGTLWDRFRDRCLIVGFIGSATTDAWSWNTHRHDVIFTLTDEYNNFFKAEGVESHLFSYGVDERLAAEVAGSSKKHDCTFVGYLGIPDQRNKTRLLEFVAQNVDFKWWGVRGPEIAENSALHRSWQGAAAGMDMFHVYKDSKIVLNEYPEMAMGKNVNIRTMEVLNVGTFLLTRAATNIVWLEQAGALVTFNSQEDCLAKIRSFLADEATREKIAAEGRRTALKHFNYRDVTRSVMDVIGKAWESKRGKLKAWPAR